jgi:hypothetical protein
MRYINASKSSLLLSSIKILTIRHTIVKEAVNTGKDEVTCEGQVHPELDMTSILILVFSANSEVN